MFNVLRDEKNDSGMCSGCSVVHLISDVIVAPESCMICGVLNCGSVRSTNGIVAGIIIPHGDNCFILHFVHCNLLLERPLLQKWKLACCAPRCGATWRRDLGPRCGPLSLFLALRRSNSLRFNGHVLMILLSFEFETNHPHESPPT